MKLEIDNSCNKNNFVSDNLYYHVLIGKQKSKINIKFTLLEIGALQVENSKEPFYELLDHFNQAE